VKFALSPDVGSICLPRVQPLGWIHLIITEHRVLPPLPGPSLPCPKLLYQPF